VFLYFILIERNPMQRLGPKRQREEPTEEGEVLESEDGNSSPLKSPVLDTGERTQISADELFSRLGQYATLEHYSAYLSLNSARSLSPENLGNALQKLASLAAYLAKNGDVDALTWCHRRGFLTRGTIACGGICVLTVAARANQVPVLECLYWVFGLRNRPGSNGFVNALSGALVTNSVEAMRCLRQLYGLEAQPGNDAPCKGFLAAVEKGSARALQCLHDDYEVRLYKDNQVRYAMHVAVTHRQLASIQCLVDTYKVSYKFSRACQLAGLTALGRGYVDILRFLVDAAGLPRSYFTDTAVVHEMATVAAAGHIGVIVYLFGCPENCGQGASTCAHERCMGAREYSYGDCAIARAARDAPEDAGRAVFNWLVAEFGFPGPGQFRDCSA